MLSSGRLYLRTTVIFALGAALLALSAASGCKGSSKDKWSVMVDKLVDEDFCGSRTHIMKCFEITEKECKDGARELLNQCVSEYRHRSNETPSVGWDTILFHCGAAGFDKQFDSKRRPKPECAEFIDLKDLVPAE